MHLVSLLGLGVLGTPIAERLLAAGIELNRTRWPRAGHPVGRLSERRRCRFMSGTNSKGEGGGRMADDEYYAGARDPAPRTVVEEVSEGLAKRRPRRVRTVESDSCWVRWVGFLLGWWWW
jgi:hypothetical protein